MSAAEVIQIPQSDLEALRKEIKALAAVAAFLPPSGQTPKLNEALAKAQGEFPTIPKNKTANVPLKSGGSYSFNYADLADVISAVTPALSKNGLAIIQTMEPTKDGWMRLVASLRHSSGEILETVLPFRIPEGRPQELGSLLTYYRRYLVSALLGVAADEDDDGNLAQGNEGAKTGARNRSSKPAGKSETPQPAKPQGQAPAAGKAPPPPPKQEAKAPAKPQGRSKADVTRMNAALAKNGWTPEQAKEFIGAAYDAGSSNDLTAEQFEEFVGAMETMEPGKAIAIARNEEPPA